MATKKPKPRLLVADDDPELLALLRLRYEKLGYEVSEATDGNMALAKVIEAKPDVIVLDVMMPGRSGWEVARALRREDVTRDIPILMLTAIGERMNEMTSPLYGADDYLDKPFDFPALDAKLEALLARSR